jgi:hypothetical protein
MKLILFPSHKGDCLLLSNADNSHHILVDGGMSSSYSSYVSPVLNELCGGKKGGEQDPEQGTLDVVYVSHIDEDHISGVLKMLDDEVAWRIHNFKRLKGEKSSKPVNKRPPKVLEVWHNAFHEQLEDITKAVESVLIASAMTLSGSQNAAVQKIAAQQSELLTSVGQAISLTRRISDSQLGITLNRVPAKKGKKTGNLMMVRKDSPDIQFGRLCFQIIGPFPEDLTKLRDEWNQWLKDEEKQLKKIQAESEQDAKNLRELKQGPQTIHTSEIDNIILPKLAQSEVWSAHLLNQAETAIKLGDRTKVTTPNLASLMFFVEEDGKTLLLTGDGHWNDILKGLERLGKIKKVKKDAEGNIVDVAEGLHVNILKVQHHGSEYNINETFCKAITADHYVFCGNGSDQNPDLNALKAIFNSRRGKSGELSSNKEVKKPFLFWFNSHSSWFEDFSGKDEKKGEITPKEQMILVEDQCKEFKLKEKEFDYVFLKKPTKTKDPLYFEIEL